MTIQIINDISIPLTAKKLLVNNPDRFEDIDKQYILKDTPHKTPYKFCCLHCADSSIVLHANNNPKFDIENSQLNESSKLAVSDVKHNIFYQLLLLCEQCGAYYLIGIGYLEPERCRDVIYIATIFKLYV